MSKGKHGGKRVGAGRKDGSRNSKSYEISKGAFERKVTPLGYLLDMLNDESLDPLVRAEMATKAAPYVHPKLSSVESKIEIENHEKALDELK